MFREGGEDGKGSRGEDGEERRERKSSAATGAWRYRALYRGRAPRRCCPLRSAAGCCRWLPSWLGSWTGPRPLSAPSQKAWLQTNTHTHTTSCFTVLNHTFHSCAHDINWSSDTLNINTWSKPATLGGLIDPKTRQKNGIKNKNYIIQINKRHKNKKIPSKSKTRGRAYSFA